MNKSIEVQYTEALLDALELRIDVSKWREMMKVSLFEDNGEVKMPITLYCDVMNFIKWEMAKINKSYGEVRGVSGTMI